MNLFGFYTYERYLEGDILEIRRLLELCGISVNCVMGANCTKDEVKRVPEADLQILLGPERCLRTGEYLKKHFGKPVLETGALPVGFDLTEKFLKDVCEILGADPSAALEEVDRYRARAFYYIGRHMGSRGFPGELCYAAEGEWSLLAGYVDFFSGYLGMRAAAIHPLYTQCSGTGREVFREMIKRYGLEDAAERKIEDVKDVILLGSANTILEIQTYSGNVYGIETSIPSSGYIDVVPKTHLGCRGALYLLEQVLNGVRLLKAWK